MPDVHWIHLSRGKDVSYIAPKSVKSPTRIYFPVGFSDNLKKLLHKVFQATWWGFFEGLIDLPVSLFVCQFTHHPLIRRVCHGNVLSRVCIFLQGKVLARRHQVCVLIGMWVIGSGVAGSWNQVTPVMSPKKHASQKRIKRISIILIEKIISYCRFAFVFPDNGRYENELKLNYLVSSPPPAGLSPCSAPFIISLSALVAALCIISPAFKLSVTSIKCLLLGWIWSPLKLNWSSVEHPSSDVDWVDGK